MKKLIVVGVLVGLGLAAGVAGALSSYHSAQNRAEKAEAALAVPAFTQFSLPDQVRAAFAGAYPTKSSGPDLIWKTKDGFVLGTDQQLVQYLGGDPDKYRKAVVLYLQRGTKSYMRTCYMTENPAGRWSAGYCIDKLHAPRL
jgi:hypothetical protein